ncbi:hypothetical protein MMC15_003140 [Xylographa vitiligo]|nr:hypothetical protein [Xylographa vitiligo]
MSGDLVKLPREVREKIYAQLLVSGYTFDADAARRPNYSAQPAILQTNKQISAEATRTLYKDNLFVVLNLKGKADRNFAWFIRIPDLECLPRFNVDEAALTINISFIDADRDDRETKRVVVFFPESLDRVLESVWDFMIGAWQLNNVEPIQLLKISLVLHPTLLSRRAATQKDLLKPFERLVGFGEVDIQGCADKEFHDNMLNRMKLAPTPDYFHEGLRHYVLMGKEAYHRERYNEAIHHWTLAGKYHGSTAAVARAWIRAGGDHSAELLLDAAHDSGPLLQVAKLGILKARLRRRDYLFVLRDFHTWELDDEELSPLLRAQVHVVASMAYHGSSLFDLGKKAFFHAQNIIVLEAVQHMDPFLAIMDDASWAEQWHMTRPGCSSFSAWKSCWDLIEIEDEQADAEAETSSEGSVAEVDSDEDGGWETTDEELSEGAPCWEEDGSSVW